MHWPSPAQRPRIAEIRDNLIARIAEAEREGWHGEAEGLKISLAGADDKLAQIDRRSPPSRPRQHRHARLRPCLRGRTRRHQRNARGPAMTRAPARLSAALRAQADGLHASEAAAELLITTRHGCTETTSSASSCTPAPG